MADLVGDHIGLRELAGLAVAAFEAGLDLAKERGIEIDLLIDRAVERPHRARGRAAARIGAAAVHHQRRRPVGLAVLGEDVLPLDLGAAQDARHEHAGFVLRRAGGARPRRRLHLRLIAAAERSSAPPMSRRGSMPSAQPTSPSTTTVPMPSPPRPPMPPPNPPPPSWRRSSILLLSGKSSKRMAQSPRCDHQRLPADRVASSI